MPHRSRPGVGGSRLVLVSTAVACALLALSACGGDDAPAVKNVLLITLDTTRADALSCYGNATNRTPSLDALAASGTRFDLAMSTASVTPVSHASILTGLYNHEHGLRVLFADGGYRLSAEADTLATVLRDYGYRTLAVHSAFPVSRFFGLQRGFDVFEDLQTDIREQKGEFRWDVASFQRRSDETTDLVNGLLDGVAPFFLWVHYWDPHDLARLPPGLSGKDARAAQVAPGVQPFYAEEVAYMDAQIGRLLDTLGAKGHADDTLVVVVADHGQGLMDHGWGAHRLLYQEQIRVPLIVRVPGVEHAPVVPDLVRTVDIFPTILDYAQIELPRPVSGRSLRPLLEGQGDEPRTAFADQINGYDWNAGMVSERPLDDFLYMTMDRQWKLIYRPRHFAQSELFDLVADPREERNLFAERPDQAVRLLGELAASAPWVTERFAPLGDGAEAEHARDALSELGYTGSEPVDTEWAWTCARHHDVRMDASAPCPTCGGAPLLIGR